MRVKVTISGSLRKMLEEETILAAAAVRRGVEAAGKQVQEELRQQVRANFDGGDKLAGAWRMKMYPPSPTATLRPTAFIYVSDKGRSNAANIIDAFEQGKPIRAKGSKYLAWPTSLNAARGRRNAGRRGGVRVSPEEMVAAKGNVVVIPTKRAGLKLWCLRVRKEQGRTPTGRLGKVRLLVGGKNVEILTGRIKAGDRKKRIETLLGHGYAPMFFLARQVGVRKRLDVAATFNRASAVLEASIRAALAA